MCISHTASAKIRNLIDNRQFFLIIYSYSVSLSYLCAQFNLKSHWGDFSSLVPHRQTRRKQHRRAPEKNALRERTLPRGWASLLLQHTPHQLRRTQRTPSTCQYRNEGTFAGAQRKWTAVAHVVVNLFQKKTILSNGYRIQNTVSFEVGTCRKMEKYRINFTIYKYIYLYIVIFHVRSFLPLMRKLYSVFCIRKRSGITSRNRNTNNAIRLFVIFRW